MEECLAEDPEPSNLIGVLATIDPGLPHDLRKPERLPADGPPWTRLEEWGGLPAEERGPDVRVFGSYDTERRCLRAKAVEQHSTDQAGPADH